MTAPAVGLELAFGSTYLTPEGSRSWTDVTDYLELANGVNITRGRTDELSEISPSTLTLTLDNRDGRFTPERAAGAYYPDVKIGVPIRVTVTPDGGSASVRFVGYVEEWPVSWDGTDADSRVTITATSRTARLGQESALRTLVEEEILALGPYAYYTMGEESGATRANDSSGNGRPQLAPWTAVAGSGAAFAPTFGAAVGIPHDDLSGVTTAGGDNPLRADLSVTSGSDWSVLFWFTTSEPSGAGMLGWGGLFVNVGTWTLNDVSLEVDSNASEASAATAHNDGALHWALLTYDDSTTTSSLYIDGTLEATRPYAPTAPFGRLTVGGNARAGFSVDSVPSPVYTVDGSFFHLTVFDRLIDYAGGELDEVLTAADSAGPFQYVPFAGIERLAELAGIDPAEVDGTASGDPVGDLALSGKTLLSAMLEIAASDGGVLFDGRDGHLVYQSRDVRYGASVGLTLAADEQEVETDYSPKLDRQGLINDATATSGDGETIVRVTDEASRSEHGTYSTSLTIYGDADDLLNAASWRVNTRSTPRLRAPSLSVDLLALDDSQQADALAVEISSRVDLTGLPVQAPSSTASVFVEGYSEAISPDAYTISLNVSEGSTWLDVAIVDSAIVGESTVGY